MPRKAAGFAPPATVPSGSRVVIAVSQGPHELRSVGYLDVPDVVGLAQGAALSRMQDAGVGVRVINDYSEVYARGKVMAQLPLPGSTTAPDAEVALLVSSGPPSAPVREVRLPDVIGMREAQAVADLQAASLSPQVTREYSATVPAGVVIAQMPDASWVSSAERRKPTWWIWLLAALGALALLVLAYVLFTGRTTTVPDVVGLTQAEAVNEIRDAGLELGRIEETQTAEVEDGTVAGQSPGPGEQARLGSAVDLVVAVSEPLVTVPDVVGATQAQAAAELRELGLDAATRPQADDSEPAGTVTEQSPQAGTRVEPGSTVTITIAQEPAAEEVEVPGVAGITRVDAEATLRGLGLRVVVVENPSETVSEDVVIAQLPAAGESVQPGGSVALVVSVGAPEDAVTVAAPDVVGDELPDAQAEIARAGLRSQPVPVDGGDEDPNEVFAQWPASGEALPVDSTMVLLYAR